MKRLPVLFFFLVLISTNLTSQSKTEIINQVRKSVVRIETFGMPDFGFLSGYSTGSGYVIAKGGYVLTNYHVIEDAVGIVVYATSIDEKKPYYAVKVHSDSILDIAILKVFDLEAEPLQFADTNEINQADEVLILGYPGASYQRDKLKATWGLISSDIADTLIQTTAPINRGNSGGPAINLQGKVVGTVRAKIIGFSVENVGLLINNRFVKTQIDSVKPGTEAITDYFGSKSLDAYKDFCDAEMIKLRSENKELLSIFQLTLDSSIVKAKAAIAKDNQFTEAKYFLASYYLQESLIQCSLEDEIFSEKFLQEFRSQITEISKYIETNKSNNSFTKLIYNLTQGDDLDCNEWSERYDNLKIQLSLSDERMEEFDDYINTGKPPSLLKRTLDGSMDEYLLEEENNYKGIIGFPFKISLSSTLTYTKKYSFKTIEIQGEPYKNVRAIVGVILKDRILKNDIAEEFTPIIGINFNKFSFLCSFNDKLPGVFRYKLNYISDISRCNDEKLNIIYGFSIGSLNVFTSKEIRLSPNNTKIVDAYERQFGVSAKLDYRLIWNIWSELEYIIPLTEAADKNACLLLGINIVL